MCYFKTVVKKLKKNPTRNLNKWTVWSPHLSGSKLIGDLNQTTNNSTPLVHLIFTSPLLSNQLNNQPTKATTQPPANYSSSPLKHYTHNIWIIYDASRLAQCNYEISVPHLLYLIIALRPCCIISVPHLLYLITVLRPLCIISVPHLLDRIIALHPFCIISVPHLFYLNTALRPFCIISVSCKLVRVISVSRSPYVISVSRWNPTH